MCGLKFKFSCKFPFQNKVFPTKRIIKNIYILVFIESILKMPLDPLTLVIIIIAGLILIELFKHIFFKKVYRFFFISITLIIILILFSGYLASKGLLDHENKFVATGASIMEGIKDNVGEEELKNLTSPIKKIDSKDLRKLYK